MRDSLSRLCLVLCPALLVFAQQNVVLSSTDSDIIYNPPLCSAVDTNCTSPWQTSNDTVPGTTVIYTSGPIPQAGNVVPQLFLTFRASTLYLRTTPFSNATVNFTLTAEPADVSITSQVNTSINLIIAVGLPESQTTTLGVTFLQRNLHTIFEIESIMLTVSNASATASFLPSPSLPLPSSPPTLAPASTSSTSSSGSRTACVALGTLLLAVAVFATIVP